MVIYYLPGADRMRAITLFRLPSLRLIIGENGRRGETENRSRCGDDAGGLPDLERGSQLHREGEN
jgi:hypothetical protein